MTWHNDKFLGRKIVCEVSSKRAKHVVDAENKKYLEGEWGANFFEVVKIGCGFSSKKMLHILSKKLKVSFTRFYSKFERVSSTDFKQKYS